MDTRDFPITHTKQEHQTPQSDASYYAPVNIDKRSREMMTDVAMMPYEQLRSYNNINMAGMPALMVAYIRMAKLATGWDDFTPPDLKAIEAFQNHHVGRAIQRIQVEAKVTTYQDLLKNIGKAEERYQKVINADVIDVTPEPEIDWSQYI